MMRKLLVLSLVVIFSIAVFAGKLSFSGDFAVSPWVLFVLEGGKFQASDVEFAKDMEWSLNGKAVSDYGYVGFSLLSGNLSSAYIETPIVEATQVTLKLKGGMFSYSNTALSGMSLNLVDSFECDTSEFNTSSCAGPGIKSNVSFSTGIGDGDAYHAANAIMIDYKDTLSLVPIISICKSAEGMCVDIDVYTKMLILDPVWLFIDLHDLGTNSDPYMVIMGTLDASKESPGPTVDWEYSIGKFGFAFRVDYHLADSKLKRWDVGGWLEVYDPITVYWKLYNHNYEIGSTDVRGVIVISPIEMLKGDWDFGLSFGSEDNVFKLDGFALTAVYNHPGDQEITYQPGLIVDLTRGDEAWILTYIKADFSFELSPPSEEEEE